MGWERFKPIVFANQANAITSLDHSPEGSQVALTVSSQLILMNTTNTDVSFNFGKSSGKLHSGSFRRDGKLIAAGGENPLIFDVSRRVLLRKLIGHTLPVHCVRFSNDNLRLFSTSDDSTSRLWDITVGTQILCLEGHKDFVRSACRNPICDELWLTGSYDHSIRTWDIRNESCSMKLDHGAPIEDVVLLPIGTLAVSVGGNFICLWDLLHGGRII